MSATTRSASNSGPHWSVDFVQHLRTVHFLLVTVSAALIMLVASAKSYRPAEAIAQLDKILDCRNGWKFSRVLAGNTPTIVTGPPDRITAIVEWRKTRVVERDRFVPLFFFWHAIQGDSNELNSFYVVGPPNTLDGFKSWWQRHQVPQEFASAGWGWWGYLRRANAEDDDHLAWVNINRKAPSETIKEGLPIVEMRLRSPKKAWEHAAFKGKFGPYEVVFEAHPGVVTLKGNSFIKVPEGCKSFESCFPDLAKATEGLGALTLDDIKQHLVQQLEKGDAVFEAFGLKIPLAQITSWGLLVLLGIQIYFLVHIKELHSRIEPTASGWDVAWVGVYSSRLSRMVFFISIAALPVSAAALLGFRAIDLVTRTTPPQWVPTATYGIAILASALLARWTWKYRPRVAVQQRAAVVAQ